MKKYLKITISGIIPLILLLSAGHLLTEDSRNSMRPVQPLPPLMTASTFSVITYNIQSRPLLDDCKGKNPAIGTLLGEYDIAGIQESFHRHDLLFKNSKLGEVYFGRRCHSLKLVNSGLAILSRFGIEKAASEYFGDEGSLENRLGSKGVMMARLRVNSGYIDFYTTHLAAGTVQDSGEAREHQIDQIIKFIEKNSSPDNAVIICGDFNLRMEKGSGRGLDKLTEKLKLSNSAAEAGQDPKNFIDHIFYRSGTKLNIKVQKMEIQGEKFSVDGKPLSDHSPIMVRFKITE